MIMGRLYFVIIMFACCLGMSAASEMKIHAIAFCNTLDEDIGESCQNDMNRFVNELGIIQDALNCDVEWNTFSGEECSKPNLDNVISGLNCGSNDVLFFYYSGHGVHAAADPADGWLPQMCLKYNEYEQDKFVSVPSVRDRLAQKRARLTIILTDCCNDNADWVSVKGLLVADGGNAELSDINIANLKKLFIESKGSVIATSSKRGQSSLGPKDGGCFSVAYWEEMYKIEQGQGTPDWKSLMSATTKRTLQYTFNKQEPDFKVNVDNVNNDVVIDDNDNPVVISVGAKELGEAFKRITNRNNSPLKRAELIPGIISQLFDTNATVQIVGRNLKTKIGRPKSISKYLEELAYSKTVNGVNIVKATKGSSEKYNYLIISEIR